MIFVNIHGFLMSQNQIMYVLITKFTQTRDCAAVWYSAQLVT